MLLRILIRGSDAVNDNCPVTTARRPEVEIIEFTYIAYTCAMQATMTRAIRLEYDDVDDRVVEEPDPQGDVARLDVMAAVDES